MSAASSPALSHRLEVRYVERSMSRLLLAILALSSVGCSTEVLNPIDAIGGGDGGAGAVSSGAGAAGGADDERYERQTLSGDITWTVTFDDVAKAAGAVDCTYTRHYEGVEDGSARWMCPSCDVMFRADVEVTEGLDDCYSQVTDRPPAALEWVGHGADTWWRGVGATMTEQGAVTLDGNVIGVLNTVQDIEAPIGGTLAFGVAGQLESGRAQGDPLHGFRAPDAYACGWDKADPAPYDGDYVLATGARLPDGVFKDACAEAMRLHDLAGAYLIIDMSAMDCPPCRQMAALEETFVANMAAQGIVVHVVTLLAPSLNDTLGETTTEMLVTWRDTYGLTSPVLADRGWGLSVFSPAIGDETGYPSWVIADPELSVLSFGTGFTSWSTFQNTIVADAATP